MIADAAYLLHQFGLSLAERPALASIKATRQEWFWALWARSHRNMTDDEIHHAVAQEIIRREHGGPSTDQSPTDG